MDKVYCMDVDGVDRVGKIVKRLRAEGATVVLCNLNGKGTEMLLASEWVQALKEDGFVVDTRSEAYDLAVTARDGKDFKAEIVEPLPPAQVVIVDAEGAVREPPSPVITARACCA